MPQGTEAKIAFDYAKIAKADYKAAAILYQKGLYAQAVYNLQQSIEKSVKSFGLMVGIIEPTDLKDVSHDSVYALLIRMDSLAEYLSTSVSYLLTANQNQIERVPQLSKVLKRMGPLIPSPESIQSDVKTIDKLNTQQMWIATLNLDTTNKFVKSALDALENNYWAKQKVVLPMRIIHLLSKLTKQKTMVNYYMGLLQSSPRSYSLAILTMWHETPTRYPPVSSHDYWQAEQYTSDKPLLKRFPFLLKHTKVLTNGVYDSALAASRITATVAEK